MTDARTLTLALGGKWYQRYGLAFCPAHDNWRTPALTLADGDDGRLLAHCKAGCNFVDVVAGMRARGLVESRLVPLSVDPARDAERRRRQATEEQKRTAQAERLWQEGHPIVGTVVETYLRGRGISCPLPDTLRLHPDCWHTTARRFPAMVGRVDGVERLAVHRTYLAPNGTDKADVEPDKAMLGKCAGGAVRLSNGPGPLVVAEGIETGLSLLSGIMRRPVVVWAALSTSGMKGLDLPRLPDRLIVAPDNDPAGLSASHSLATRASRLGWEVSILPPPEAGDWNDVLRSAGCTS